MGGPSHGGRQTHGGSLEPGWHHFDRRQPGLRWTHDPHRHTVNVQAGYQTLINLNHLGISFLGKAYEEDKLLGYAYGYRQGSQ